MNNLNLSAAFDGKEQVSSLSCPVSGGKKITMDQQAKRKRMEQWLFLAVCIGLNATGQTVPPGAAALGYTNCVINDTPTVSEIAPANTGNYNWFSGRCWVPSNQIPSLTNYSTVSNALTLNFTGAHLDLDSMPRDCSTGALPMLAGSNGFYAEFDIRLSDNNSDHWAAVWLEPMEAANLTDWYSPDPAGFHRWMEFDLQESGWDTGLAGTVHAWTGFITNQTSIYNSNNCPPAVFDMSQKHTFGGSYDPIHQQVAWWVDGVQQMTAGSPDVPAVAVQQHFYLILSTWSHGLNVPYSMYVTGVRAYVPSLRPSQPTNLKIVAP
jgi:hypothetical protein